LYGRCGEESDSEGYTFVASVRIKEVYLAFIMHQHPHIIRSLREFSGKNEVGNGSASLFLIVGAEFHFRVI
jgi:hypothetical protein